jgi:hypothetical protein
MQDEFVELKSTENQTVYVRPEAVGAFEVVPASNRVEGHVKIFIGGFKFLVQIEKDELLRKLNGNGK